MENVNRHEQDVLVLVNVRCCLVLRSQRARCCFADGFVVDKLPGVRVDVKTFGKCLPKFCLMFGFCRSEPPRIVTWLVIADSHQECGISRFVKCADHTCIAKFASLADGFCRRKSRLKTLDEILAVPVTDIAVTGQHDEFTAVILLEHFEAGDVVRLPPGYLLGWA
jgi:hypothetical protein